MTSVNVFRPGMVLGVVRKVDRGFVVHVQRRGSRLSGAQLVVQGAKVHRLFGGLGGCDYLGLAAGEGNGGLLLGGPGDCCAVVDEYISGC
eukprot:4291274-Pleurochrysis_carterae.AAC.1